MALVVAALLTVSLTVAGGGRLVDIGGGGQRLDGQPVVVIRAVRPVVRLVPRLFSGPGVRCRD